MKEVIMHPSQLFGIEDNSILTIVTQAFYGNRTITGIREKDMDRFIQGIQVDYIDLDYPVDTTIVRIPGDEHLVLVYNKYQEKEQLANGQRWFKEEGTKIRPLARIPEQDLEIYSRCIALRMDDEGHFSSIQEEDFDKVMKYLAP